MWMEKIRHGVLQVSTAAGPRYVNPSLVERVRLLWMFRNFHILNDEVLNRHERSLVERLCREQRLLSQRKAGDRERLCIIGTVERTLAAGRRPAASAPASAALRRAHSA